ncbi:hypothetical protein [Rhodopseudomonas sp.]|uniref:hypothetical protein n=1 Tax=Rhodopseudomonas sp. TaxID=1078 RepID=UPI002ED9CE85
MVLFNIDVLCTVSSGPRRKSALRERDQLETKTHRFGKQNRGLDSPRRPIAAFLATAFIFDERRPAWLTVGIAQPASAMRDRDAPCAMRHGLMLR